MMAYKNYIVEGLVIVFLVLLYFYGKSPDNVHAKQKNGEPSSRKPDHHHGQKPETD